MKLIFEKNNTFFTIIVTAVSFELKVLLRQQL